MDSKLYNAAVSGDIDFLSTRDRSFFFEQETVEKNSALHLAAEFNQMRFAEKIIASHPQLQYKTNSKEDTPLHIAARVGCLEIAELLASGHLITESQQVEANRELLIMVNSEKDTALHIAVRNGHSEIVKLLIQKEKELTKNLNAIGESPLFLAVDRKLFKIACYILDSAPECHYQGRNEMNALHAAIIRTPKCVWDITGDGRKQSQCSQQQQQPAGAGTRQQQQPAGTTPAAPQQQQWDHKLKSFRSVLEDWIPIKIAVGCFRNLHCDFELCGNSCLFVKTSGPFYLALEKMSSLRSCEREGFTFMEEFIQKFPSAIKERDEFGWTPLHYAAFFGNTIAVELLLKNNDKQMPARTYVYLKDKEGLSALHIAAKEGQVQVMKQLTETFPDICELVDERGRTAFHVAVENGKVDTVQCVLKTKGLERLINVQNTEGNTSLHLAAIHGHYEIVNNLLDDTRVDKKAMNKEGFTAIKIIVSKMELTDFQKGGIVKKLWRAGGLRSLEGILRREYREKENVEMKERGHIESMKDRADEKEREGMVVKNMSLNTKRKRAEDKEFKRLKESANNHLLVATIITTVTFAAGFTMPGGYKSDGPDEGMANFSRKTSFKSFLISDAIAFCFSVTSMFFHFSASGETNLHDFSNSVRWAAQLTYISNFAMVIAFISSTNVVLAGSSGLAIANIAIGCCFFLFFYQFFFNLRTYNSFGLRELERREEKRREEKRKLNDFLFTLFG